MDKTVADLPDANLVDRAFRCAISNGRKRDLNWVKISNAFGLGSTYSAQLCERFGIDPDAKTERML